MSRYLRGIAFVAVLTLNCGVAGAEDNIESAKNMMPGCRGWLAHTTEASPLDLVLQGLCAGQVKGVGYEKPGVCIPPTSTNLQGLRIVVQYIDARPTRQHEPFLALALEALRAAWPCKD